MIDFNKLNGGKVTDFVYDSTVKSDDDFAFFNITFKLLDPDQLPSGIPELDDAEITYFASVC